jgi:hypothetical protein
MKIETKFNLGQWVWVVSTRHMRQKRVECPTCKGLGTVTILENGNPIGCPECYTRGHIFEDRKCLEFSKYQGSIGKIQVEHYVDKVEIKYMIDSTGVGAGYIWREDQVFPTKEALDAYTTKREKEYNDRSIPKS